MTPGRRQRRGQGAELRAVPAAPEVTLVVRPAARGRGQTYLERASLIAMTEKPVIVMSHPLPGEQTQIVRRPVRKANARRSPKSQPSRCRVRSRGARQDRPA